MRPSRNIFLPLLCSATLAWAAPVEVLKFDYSDYDNLLRSYVNADGLVHYEGLRTVSLKELQTFIDQLATVKLKKATPPEQIAFWINAYNAHVIQQVLAHPQMKKLNDVPTFYETSLRIAEGDYSLNDIQQKVLPALTNDPRVHFALANGAVGSPTLRNYAFTPSTLEARLREVSTDFANSPKYVRLEKEQLHISKVMQWHADAFKVFGGPATYLNRLVDPAKRKDAAAVKKQLLSAYDQAIFEFDWTVNDLRINTTNRKGSTP